jgi:hypothetical protein
MINRRAAEPHKSAIFPLWERHLYPKKDSESALWLERV